MSQAFADEWLALGGSIPDVQDVSREANLPALRQRLAESKADLVFLSADAADARLAGPYLPRHVPIYVASLVHTGVADPLANADLEGMRLFEMPWLVQPDHPAVMVHPRQESLAGEWQRFYALGIDACRLAPLLAAHREAFDLDGVTGRIRMRPGGRVEREPVAAVFRAGSAVPDAPRQ
jgi:outer membrane PBP1 activator LpoA protein